MFPSAELISSGETILITDQLEAPGDFILHRMVSSHLKESKGNRCIILSISNDLPRWKTVSSKLVREVRSNYAIAIETM